MPSNKQKSWYKERSFISQQAIYQQAINDLYQCTSIEEALSVKQAYSKYLLFSTEQNAEDTFIPYIPSTKFGYSYVCNAAGNVQIGNEICNYNNVYSSSELNAFFETRSYSETGQNYAKKQIDDRRFYVSAHQVGAYVYATLRAYKQVIFWFQYATQYHFEYATGPELIWLYPDYGWINRSPFIYDVINSSEGLWTDEFSSGETIFIGDMGNNNSAQTVFRVYSRGTGEEGSSRFWIKFPEE